MHADAVPVRTMAAAPAAVVPARTFEIDGFAHPLSAVYRRSTLPHIESLLAANRLRPVFLFDAVRTRRVKPEEVVSVDPELRTLRNLNTMEDYLAALAEAKVDK